MPKEKRTFPRLTLAWKPNSRLPATLAFKSPSRFSFRRLAWIAGSFAVAAHWASSIELPAQENDPCICVSVSSENPAVDERRGPSDDQTGPIPALDGSTEQPVPAEVQNFIRELALVLLPPKFDDEDGWGDEKKIESGLDIDFDDGKIKTHRRWKSVNHGSWIRASGSLVEPEKTMTLKIFRRAGADATEQIYRIQLLARANVSGTQQQWNHGVMFWSVTADAEADIQIDVNLKVRTDVVAKESGGSSLQIQPEVTHAVMRLNGFSLKRISHVRGGMAREFGEAFEGLVKLAVERQNKKLPSQINKALVKQKDKLQVPVDPGSLFDFFKGEEKKSDGKKGDGNDESQRK